jgi:hypothetical protein
MSKSYQVSYIVTAFDKASATFKTIEKNLNRLDKSFDKVASRDHMRARATIADSKNITDQKVKNLNNWAREENKAYKQSIIREKNTLREKASALAAWERTENKAYKQSIIREKNTLRERVSALAAWEKQENRAHRQSIIKEKNTLRERVSALRSWEREEARSYRQAAFRERLRVRNIDDAGSMANRAAIAVSAPAGVMTALSLKNTMTLEQSKLNLLTQFGKEGERVFQEMYKYATETAFSITSAVDLTRRIEAGRASGYLKFQDTNAMLETTKNIGNILLAYTGDAERMGRAIFQLTETATGGFAEFKKDLFPLMKAGIPVFQILKAYTGMDKQQIEETYGKQLPVQLLYDALDAWSKSDVVLRSIDLRSRSLTQSWDSLKESLFVFSGEYGKVLSETFGLTDKFKEIAGFLQSSTEEFQNQDDISTSLKKQALAFGAAWLMTVPLLAGGSFAVQKMTASVGGGIVLLKRLLTMSGIMSGLYLTTVDWKTVIKDIDENGFTGLVKHLDVVAASFLAILTTVNLIKSAVGAGLATKLLGSATAASAASLVAPVAVVYGGSKLAEKYLETRPKEDQELFKGLLSIIPTFGNPQPVVNVQNNVNVDKNGDVKIETKKTYDPKNYSNKSETTGKRSPYSNPIIYDL